MLTQCPSCQTTFRVTSEILRVADGQVRCGRCQTQFDALERLLDEADPGDAQSGRHSQPPRSGSPAAPVSVGLDDPAAHEDITLEGRHIEISGRYRLDEATGDQPQITAEALEEWAIDAEEEAGENIEVAAAADELEELAAAEEPQQPDLDERGDEPPHPPQPQAMSAARPRHERTAAHAPDDFELLPPAQPRSAIAPVWKILAGPLALLLIVQLVHNYRSTLARHPRVGPALLGLYDTLGLTLRPDWDLHAYEILQWHVGSDPLLPGTLKVRANIKNVARFAQPYPILKLVLEDRWGEQARARELEPAEYLDPATAPDRLLAPAQQATATISIVDPGPDAEGFRFDVCLRGTKGIVCAADVPEGRK